MGADLNVSGLVVELLAKGRECEWIEFKHNNVNAEDIGEYISALSNAARLSGQERGYLVWGVEDETCQLVGTDFDPNSARKGAEELKSWLSRMTNPRLNLRWRIGTVGELRVVVLEIPAAMATPTAFQKTRFIRVGSYKKKLSDNVGKERDLWAALEREPFERGTAIRGLQASGVLDLLDIQAYLRLTGQSLPDSFEKVVGLFVADRLVKLEDDGLYSVTNLGALLFASNLQAFDGLQRKAIRVITYTGDNRVEALQEQEGTLGYAAGFERLIAYINGRLPQNEVLGAALRTSVKMYPEVAVRELVANALIHQDLRKTGTGPLVEIFSDRIEVTNPGLPLIDTNRFIDHPPESRNDLMASFMRRVNICEERGSGIDKVVSSVEVAQLPPPNFLVLESHTKAVLFALRSFTEMSSEERIRACYQHACLQQVSFKKMTNESLRARFGIEKKNHAMASRVIRDTIEAELIRSANPGSTSKKLASYEPFWA